MESRRVFPWLKYWMWWIFWATDSKRCRLDLVTGVLVGSLPMQREFSWMKRHIFFLKNVMIRKCSDQIIRKTHVKLLLILITLLVSLFMFDISSTLRKPTLFNMLVSQVKDVGGFFANFCVRPLWRSPLTKRHIQTIENCYHRFWPWLGEAPDKHDVVAWSGDLVVGT